jgi:putative transposase
MGFSRIPLRTVQDQPHNYLRRLPSEYYRGRAFVHWTMTIDERKTGWLIPVLYYKFREILTHTAFRYGLCCPLYCCMPDHLHFLWAGILESCDQRNAARFLRKQLNIPLARLGVQLQKQPHDHVLRDDERQESAFEAVAEYIARNPERAGLVPADGFRDYGFTGCLIPGYPDLSPWQNGYWTLFWRLYSRLSEHGLAVIDFADTSSDGAVTK